MAALTQNVNRVGRENVVQSYKIASGFTVYTGSIVALNASGFLVPYTNTPDGQMILGIVQSGPGANSDGSGAMTGNAAGTIEAMVLEEKVTLYNVSVAGVVNQADLGKRFYASSDNDLTLTQPGAAGVPFGRIVRYHTGDKCDVEMHSYDGRSS